MSQFELFHNTAAQERRPYPFADVLSIKGGLEARREIERCPMYRRTPLLELPALAARLRVSSIRYKNEASRFGLGSFKSLGGGYAVSRVILRRIYESTGARPSVEELVRRRYADVTRELTVTCATEGNHGRAVAAAAQTFGCQCVIFLHSGVSQGREDAIAALGAKIVRVTGTYDDSVAEAQRIGQARGWEVVSDTSSDGYREVPAIIMQGYMVMVQEVISELTEIGAEIPTHVFVQGGVGGLAGAVTAYFWERFGQETAPIICVVEPSRADCLYRSIMAGRPASAMGDLNTIMAGLACGEVSILAWEILREGAEFFATISDDLAISSMRLLAAGIGGDPAIVAGPSGAAGLAAVLAASEHLDSDRIRRNLRLTASSRILVFGTEGATDQAEYESLVTGINTVTET